MAGRDEIDYKLLEAEVRKMIVERAQIALEIYTLEKLKYDDAGYEYERHEGQRSIRDPKSQSIEQTARGVSIIVEAEGAEFIEYGNRPPGGGLIRKKRGTRGMIIPLAGGGMAFAQAVRSYGPTDRLKNAVMKAFGIGV